MRLAGWLLLIAGLALCLSIGWAALGFLLMGVGLVSLRTAEARRNRAAVAGKAAPEFLVTNLAVTPPPPTRVEPALARVEPPPLMSAQRPIPVPLSDAEKWRILLATDPDVAHLAAALLPYGQKHVDRLAVAYLAETDRARLPEIIDRIVETARHDAKRIAIDKAAPPYEPIDPPEIITAGIETDLGPPSLQAAPAPGLSAKRRFMDSAIPDDEPDQPAIDEVPKAVDDSAREETVVRGPTIVAADEDLSDLLSQFAPNAESPKRD